MEFMEISDPLLAGAFHFPSVLSLFLKILVGFPMLFLSLLSFLTYALVERLNLRLLVSNPIASYFLLSVSIFL